MRSKAKIFSLVLVLVMLMTGCSTAELEQRCFPMMAVVDYDTLDDKVGFTYVFPVLRKEADAGQEHNLNSEIFWGNHMNAAQKKYEDSLNRKPDYNHLKVIVLSEAFVNEGLEYEKMIQQFWEEKSIPRNTYVCVTSDVEAFLKTSENIPEDLGTYVEQLLLKQKKANEKERKLLTVGEILDEYYNNQKKLWAPQLDVENGQIIWDGYYAMPQILQQTLAQKVLRFHVIANSDSKEDQAVKLKVRDAIGNYMRALVQNGESREQVETLILSHRKEIEQRAEQVLKENGCSYGANVFLGKVHFPQKVYGNYVFPEGDYQALEIKLGKSCGHNWWCVLYPNMCFSGSVYEVVDENAEKELQQLLTPEEYEKILKPGKCRVKWKFLELFEKRG